MARATPPAQEDERRPRIAELVTVSLPRLMLDDTGHEGVDRHGIVGLLNACPVDASPSPRRT